MERLDEMGFDRKPEIRGLDEQIGRHTPGFGREGLDPVPVADVLDRGIGMQDIEGIVGIFRHATSVTGHILEPFGVFLGQIAREIQDRDAHAVSLEKPIGHRLPILGLAADIEDSHFASGLMHFFDQGEQRADPLRPHPGS
ncbi:MAG TPA: hypothetical protein VLO11_15745, partial [Luteolibacter sp.]|nr:hypothetical protein [Luteolibacter sp.]